MSNIKAIVGSTIVNEGKIFMADVVILDDIIVDITEGSLDKYPDADIIDGTGLHLLPGVIDDQVHFRDPGITYKGDISTESKAAIAGGVTSYMDMPNTVPNCLTQELLEEKYEHASKVSYANYSFYMGASNNNLDEIVKTDPKKICGIKVFMGSSTGNMLVDNEDTLAGIFKNAPTLVAVHCEDEKTIIANTKKFHDEYGDNAPTSIHPEVRSAEACYLSSSKAVELAKKHGTRLHVLHLTTAREMELFRNDIPLEEKMITAEVCIHHLWFSSNDYDIKGNFIKWNPSIKYPNDQKALINAVIENKIDVIATDHAPHTLEEKERPYIKAPSGGPMVQNSLQAALEMYKKGIFSLELVVQKMCHNPAKLYRINKRGAIRTGYKADLVLVDLNSTYKVNKSNILYKCGWSPMEGEQFSTEIITTILNGKVAFNRGRFNEDIKGERLTFNR